MTFYKMLKSGLKQSQTGGRSTLPPLDTDIESNLISIKDKKGKRSSAMLSKFLRRVD